MDLDYVIRNSNDAILEDHIYSKGNIIIKLFLTNLDKQIKLIVKTNQVAFDHIYLDKNEEFYRTCRIELLELSTVLSTENNIYIPPCNFGKLMRETRLNLNLAYGKKNSEIKFIFSLVGYGRLICCLISNLEDIYIDVKPDVVDL